MIDLISMKAQGPDGQDIEIPSELSDQAQELRDALAETIAESDDELTMKFLEGEELTEEELLNGLAEGVKSGSIVPVVAASALTNTCVQGVMDSISVYMPAPDANGGVGAKDLVSEESITLDGDPTGPPGCIRFQDFRRPFRW